VTQSSLGGEQTPVPLDGDPTDEAQEPDPRRFEREGDGDGCD
jgi:hypothetical protein